MANIELSDNLDGLCSRRGTESSLQCLSARVEWSANPSASRYSTRLNVLGCIVTRSARSRDTSGGSTVNIACTSTGSTVAEIAVCDDGVLCRTCGQRVDGFSDEVDLCIRSREPVLK